MKILGREKISLDEIRQRFFDPDLADMIGKYLVDGHKDFMVLQTTLSTLVGAAAGDLCPTERDLENFMETIAALVGSAAEHAYEVKKRREAENPETPNVVH